jgi:phosphate starvation-inducible protein PhoH
MDSGQQEYKKTRTQRKKEDTKPREVYVNKKELINSIVTKRPRKKFLTDSQKDYYDILCNNQITICSGPAGVGKSFVAMRKIRIITW